MAIHDGLPRAVPEDMGMSTSRLARVTPVMQGYVDNGKIPCALTMIARGGRLVHFEKFGMQDIAAAKPVAFDTIFRLYSMTKPITSIAVMMLYEEGTLSTHDTCFRICAVFQRHEGLHRRWQGYC